MCLLGVSTRLFTVSAQLLRTLLSDWAVAPAGLGLRRVELYAEPDNRASQMVAERAGFVRGDLVRGGIALRGRRRDVVRFVLES